MVIYTRILYNDVMKRVSLFSTLLLCLMVGGFSVLAVGTIDINSASLSELDQITSVGPAIAQRIIDARPFTSVDDLLRVNGIGEKTLQKIKDQGLAYVQNGQVAPAPNSKPETPAPIVQAKPEPAPVLLPQIVYSTGIIINEVLPAPEGSDEENEYVEIYNAGATNIDISGWKLQDIQGTSKTYVFLQNTIIASNGYLVLKRPQTNIILNNDEDGLNLLWPDGKITDSISFTKAPSNQSYNKTAGEWQWSTTQTPGTKNTITGIIKIAKATKKSTTALPNNQKTDNKYLSAISQSPNLNSQNSSSNPWLLFLVVLISAIILGAIVLILKLKLVKKDILN